MERNEKVKAVNDPSELPTTNDVVQIGNILIGNDRLAQLDRSHTVAAVAREDFLSGEITFQRVCKQPLILSLIAIAMIWIGLRTGWGIVEWLISGGTVYDVSIMMILLLPGGMAFLLPGLASGAHADNSDTPRNTPHRV